MNTFPQYQERIIQRYLDSGSVCHQTPPTRSKSLSPEFKKVGRTNDLNCFPERLLRYIWNSDVGRGTNPTASTIAHDQCRWRSLTQYRQVDNRSSVLHETMLVF
ncbi:hypothetical protein Trydic_g3357 [Trypoxylus dichotomus]